MKLGSEVSIVRYLVLIYYLLATTVFYMLAIYVSGNGISFQIFGGGDDGLFYWEQAMNVFYDLSWIRTSIYPWIIGKYLQLIGTESVFAIRMFNFAGVVLLIHFSLKLVTVQLESISLKKNATEIRKRAYLLSLVSYIAYISLFFNITTSIFRDVWIYMLFVTATYLATRWLFEKNWTYFMLLVPTIWLLGQFRTYALLSFVLAMSIWFVFTLVKRPVVFLIMFLIVFGVIYSFFMDIQVPIVERTLRSALQYRSSGLGQLGGSSQMGIQLDATNYLGFLANYAHSYLGNLVGPLPWHIRSVSTLIAFVIEAVPMILILGFLWLRRGWVTKVQGFILTQAFVWNGLIAITNDNIGTSLRLRAIAYLLILLVFVVTYSQYRAETGKKSSSFSRQ